MASKSGFPSLGTKDATRETYRKQGARLARNFSEQAGSTDSAQVVAQFLTRGKTYSQRTFRLYKAALLQHLTDQGAPPSVVRLLTEASSKDSPKRSGATSGKKAKTVDQTDRVLLVAALRARRSGTAAIAADYFEAGLVLGPRPVEWIGARFAPIGDPRPSDAPADMTHSLVLRNAKRDQEGVRGNGDERPIYLRLTAHEAAVVARVIADADANQADWEPHYHRMRAALRYAGKSLWPKRKKVPSFYTTRHQSQADAKASGMPLASIAAIYGHASDNTATQHYSRASQGDKNMYKAAPSALSLAQVRNKKATSRLVERSNQRTVKKETDNTS